MLHFQSPKLASHLDRGTNLPSGHSTALPADPVVRSRASKLEGVAAEHHLVEEVERDQVVAQGYPKVEEGALAGCTAEGSR